MPDEPTKPDSPEETSTSKNDPALTDLVSAIKDQGERQAKLLEHFAKPKEEPVKDTYSEERQAYEAKVKAAKQRYKELCDEGKWDEALEVLEQSYANPPRRQEDLSTNPLVKATAKSIERAVKGDFKEIVDTYADEVDTALKALSPVDRLDEDKVREAVRRVQAMHADDIIESRVQARLKEEQEKLSGLPPGNVPNPSLGESRDTKLYDLNFQERQTAKSLGVSYKEYARMKQKWESGDDEIISVEELNAAAQGD